MLSFGFPGIADGYVDLAQGDAPRPVGGAQPLGQPAAIIPFNLQRTNLKPFYHLPVFPSVEFFQSAMSRSMPCLIPGSWTPKRSRSLPLTSELSRGLGARPSICRKGTGWIFALSSENNSATYFANSKRVSFSPPPA